MLGNLIMLVIIVLFLGLTGILNNYKPRGKTPEEAIELYLKFITKKYEIMDIGEAIKVDGGIEYTVKSMDKYNYRNKNIGRQDGENIHYLILTESNTGWYVSFDCNEL